MGNTASRGANITWCEAITHLNHHSPFVAEYFNTWSNIFFVLFGVIDIIREFQVTIKSSAIIFADSMFMIVGFGSSWFHAQRTFIGELFDELPMSIMAFAYVLCLDQLHWLTMAPYRVWTNVTMATLALSGWLFYLALGNHDLFAAIFTVQVIVPGLIAFFSVINSSRFFWYCSLIVIIVGKLLWNWERELIKQNVCPESEYDPRFYLHSAWHFFSATAHLCFMLFIAHLRKAVDGEYKANNQSEDEALDFCDSDDDEVVFHFDDEETDVGGACDERASNHSGSDEEIIFRFS